MADLQLVSAGAVKLVAKMYFKEARTEMQHPLAGKIQSQWRLGNAVKYIYIYIKIS